MKNPTMSAIPEKAKDAFWAVVEDCLVEIFGLKKQDAHQKSIGLRTRVEVPQPGIFNEIFYHAEPFYVACDIAGKELDVSSYQSQYDNLLSRHNW